MLDVGKSLANYCGDEYGCDEGCRYDYSFHDDYLWLS
jgi:hypothetical protein